MKLSDFDYLLPEELIAQVPIEPRDHSKLMVLNPKTGDIQEDQFFNVGHYLTPNDVLVFNQSKVFPARLFGHKETGGKIEVLLVRYFEELGWEFISHPGIKDGTNLTFEGNKGNTADDLKGFVQNGYLKFDLSYTEVMDKLLVIGHTPLPPYIDPGKDVSEPNIRQIYQTVYATEIGSIAAPTAGFHFTTALLEQLKEQGIQTEFVILHVGIGTFRPVKTENILDHKMHSEWYSILPEVADRLLQAKVGGKRIVCVGTTSCRTLEAWTRSGKVTGDTDIFIYPGVDFKFVDALITNFHLPKSTLLMLVSALAGLELIKKAYGKAIENRYRFFSYGDAMFII